MNERTAVDMIFQYYRQDDLDGYHRCSFCNYKNIAQSISRAIDYNNNIKLYYNKRNKCNILCHKDTNSIYLKNVSNMKDIDYDNNHNDDYNICNNNNNNNKYNNDNNNNNMDYKYYYNKDNIYVLHYKAYLNNIYNHIKNPSSCQNNEYNPNANRNNINNTNDNLTKTNVNKKLTSDNSNFEDCPSYRPSRSDHGFKGAMFWYENDSVIANAKICFKTIKRQQKIGQDNFERDLTSLVEKGKFNIQHGETTYRLVSKIGNGGCGEVYKAVNMTDKRCVAAKLESSLWEPSLLIHESEVYRKLQGGPGIANLHFFRLDVMGCNVMVMDLLGPSLHKLFTALNFKFSLKTVLMLADQMITAMEYIHERNLIHRDLKPDNMVMGLGKASNKLYIIDFGFATDYRDLNSNRSKFIGTCSFASLNSLLDKRQSCRDDMESIGYILLYFVKGSLPWLNVGNVSRRRKRELVRDIKLTTSLDDLGHGIPPEFITFLKICRNLHYEETPNYAYMREMFKDLFISHDYIDDGLFDWHIAASATKSC